MRFRNYCVIIMGNTEGVNDEIKKVAEMEPNFLETKGITMATFTAFVSPSELTEWFREHKRNIIVFDLDSNFSGVHFIKKQIQEGLFSFVKDVNLEEMNKQFLESLDDNVELCENLIEDFSGDTLTNLLSEDAIEKMNKLQKEDLLNKLIENGLDKLTEEDKKLLSLLTK